METSLWIASGLVPALISVVACVGACRLDRRPPDTIAGAHSLGYLPLWLGMGWTLAVIAGLIGQRYISGDESSLLWPSDFWQRGFWGMTAAAVTMGLLGPNSTLRWVMGAIIAFSAAAFALPSGDGWDDALPLHRGWMLLLGGSGLASMWSLERLGRGTAEHLPADRWLPLVVLATLAGPMFVGVTTYSALATWTISAIVSTIVCVLFAAMGHLRAVVGIAYPASIFCIVMISAGRFYSYENHPWWTYAGILWVAPAVALSDGFVGKKSTAIRAGAAALIAIAMILWTVVWQFTVAVE